ncbi:hypothetical protein Q0590_32820 [Rhodocytophaga aerolata]|uniref:Uncharacterized protein n=1 Tax=Rhodocytophaga aerolata TaxID=455078 RepID=A0ABT8RIW1_9BACT|nr:hypothetical protein [Rhodocytophaga aerolata]MDO1451103.1 hypothetical protein [Rhodocytophaga aerolata]
MAHPIHPDPALVTRLSADELFMHQYQIHIQQMVNSLNKFSSAVGQMSKQELVLSKQFLLAQLQAKKLHPLFYTFMIKEIDNRLEKCNG